MEKSICMQKQVKDNAEDLQKEFLDMKNWEQEMKQKDDELRKETSGKCTLAPIRSKTKSKTKKESVKQNGKDIQVKRIKSYDYSAWDKFDADEAYKQLDNEDKSDDSEDEPMLKEELEKAHKVATKHKNEGNIFVQQQKWQQAIACYTQAIKAFPYDAIFYANRALCQLKLDNLHSAESDCSAAIQLDETYVKAYHRRATARVSLKQYKEAKDDLEKILKLEPSNKEAKLLLSQIDSKIKASKPKPAKGNTEELSEKESVEKKIGKKLCSNTSAKVETLSNKHVNEIKDTVKEDKKVEEDIKDITVIKNERDPRIPDWLPEKDDVIVIEPIHKPPHLRSNRSLTRIPVEEVVFSTIQDNIIEPAQKICNENKHSELKETNKDNNIKKSNVCTKLSEDSADVNNIPLVPKTAVQFVRSWNTSKSSEFRYKYLKQIHKNSLPNIFQDSMEFDIFGEILEVLSIEFIKRKEPVFCYLEDLSQVKRFRALIMFISNKEKECLRTLFEYCKEIENVDQEKREALKVKYEV